MHIRFDVQSMHCDQHRSLTKENKDMNISKCECCGFDCVDTLTMVYVQCVDCGGECPSLRDVFAPSPTQPTTMRRLDQEMMESFYDFEVMKHYNMEKTPNPEVAPPIDLDNEINWVEEEDQDMYLLETYLDDEPLGVEELFQSAFY